MIGKAGSGPIFDRRRFPSHFREREERSLCGFKWPHQQQQPVLVQKSCEGHVARASVGVAPTERHLSEFLQQPVLNVSRTESNILTLVKINTAYKFRLSDFLSNFDLYKGDDDKNSFRLTSDLLLYKFRILNRPAFIPTKT